MQNLAEYLLELDFPDEQARSLYNNKVYTLGTYRKVVNEFIQKFEAVELPRNVSAVMVLSDSPLVLAIYLAFIKYGIVPLLITSYTLDDMLDKVMTVADSTILVTDGTRDVSRFADIVILLEITGDCEEGNW